MKIASKINRAKYTRMNKLNLKDLMIDINDQQLDAMEKQLEALWAAIERAIVTDTWPAKTSVLCDWCDFKAELCPAWNDVPPSTPANRDRVDTP